MENSSDSVCIHTEEQVRVDSHTCTHTLADKLTFGSKRNSRVSVFRYGLNRLLLVDPHIKHSHKGRIWGMLYGTAAARFQVCLSLPAVGRG